MNPRRIWNWARTQSCVPAAFHHPSSEPELVAALAGARAAGQKVRVVGGAHSWSRAAMTDDCLISLDGLSGIVSADQETKQVTVWAGTRLHDLNDALAGIGLAMSNLGSVSAQSVAGAISTGTHGSGPRHGILASQVTSLRLLKADGGFLQIDGSARPELLRAARVSLGVLGIITQVTLQCVPAFRLRCSACPVPFEQALAELPEAIQASSFVKYWWLPDTDEVQVFRYEPTEAAINTSRLANWIDENIINRYLFSLCLWVSQVVPAIIPWMNRVVRLAYFRPADLVDRSDRLFNLPMPARHEEMEYAIPIEHAADALRRTRQLIEEQDLKVNFIVELRVVAAGEEWLSPTFGRDTAYLGAYIAGGPSESAYLEGMESIARSYGGRPHWGKTFFLTSEQLASCYPRWADFCALRRKLDPGGLFSSPFTARVFGDGQGRSPR